MKSIIQRRPKAASERASLRRRIKQFHERLNEGDGVGCFEMVDPKLRIEGKVEPSSYASQVKAFIAAYGVVKPMFDHMVLHLDPETNPRDKRPFAYCYIVWQDARGELHLFPDRWIKDGGRWYTRVAGLIVNRPHSE